MKRINPSGGFLRVIQYMKQLSIISKLNKTKSSVFNWISFINIFFFKMTDGVNEFLYLLVFIFFF